MIRSRKFTGLLLGLFLIGVVLGANPGQALTANTPNDIAGHWAQAQIQAMLNNGFAAGYPDGTFQADRTMTRAEFMAMVNRTFAFTGTVPINFSDVQPGDWFYNDVGIAIAQGYMSGFGDGTMRPNQPITRQEMAVVAAQLLKLDTTDLTPLAQFNDRANMPVWSQGPIAAMVKAGYLSGLPGGNFAPQMHLNRGMAAYVLANLFGEFPKPPGPPVTPPGQSGNSGGNNDGSSNGPSFYIEDIDAANVNVTPDGTSRTYTLSAVNTDPVGWVTATFNRPIQKDDKYDMDLRAYSDYNAQGQLTWLPGAEDFVRDLLFEHAAGGDADQLSGTHERNYALIYDAMSLYFEGNPEVKCIQVDMYDLANHKLTVTVNITPP